MEKDKTIAKKSDYKPVTKAVNTEGKTNEQLFDKELGIREELLFIKHGHVAYSYFLGKLREKGFDVKSSVFQPKLMRSILNAKKKPKYLPKKASYYDFTSAEIETLLEAKKELAAFYSE